MHPPSIPIFRWYGAWQRLFSQGIPRKFNRILNRWMLRQRWCMEKGETKVQFKLIEAFPVMQGQVWWLFLQSPSRTYQLPIILTNDPPIRAQSIACLNGAVHGWIVDAWQWPPFSQWLLNELAGTHADHRFRIWKHQELMSDLAAQPLTREQSNSAIMFGDKYFMKALRVVYAGLQPEEEISQTLTARQFANSIPVKAGISVASEPKSSCLALLYQYAKVQANGWEWYFDAIQQLRSLSLVQQETSRRMLIDAAKQLGQRTRSLHECLGQPSDDPAFSPEPFTLCDYQALSWRIGKLYQTTCIKLSRAQRRNGAIIGLINRLRTLRPTVSKITSAPMTRTEFQRHRIHGDYHLGQVLRSDNDWFIIDFEGEPLRSLAERRAKDHPCRDVAGMLRSFAYLEHVALQKSGNLADTLLHEFFCELRTAFQCGYFRHGPGEARESSLLLIYELEKALYEINYELASRPDWLYIPLNGAVALLEGWGASGA